jgi:hypothetical protein
VRASTEEEVELGSSSSSGKEREGYGEVEGAVGSGLVATSSPDEGSVSFSFPLASPMAALPPPNNPHPPLPCPSPSFVAVGNLSPSKALFRFPILLLTNSSSLNSPSTAWTARLSFASSAVVERRWAWAAERAVDLGSSSARKVVWRDVMVDVRSAGNAKEGKKGKDKGIEGKWVGEEKRRDGGGGGRRISVDVDEQEENKGERNQGMKESTNR